MISGFTFIHNALEAGYPIFEALDAVRRFVDEIVIVDMQSTDGTREVLEHKYSANAVVHPVHIIDGEWQPGGAGACLEKAHSLYRECNGDIIWHFEADEVYSGGLAGYIHAGISSGNMTNIVVPRIQVEQNFQRARWYPEYVHRVFPKDSRVVKRGHTTDKHIMHVDAKHEVNVSVGLLWDVTNCFRDNCIKRFQNQAELWGHELRCRFAHFHAFESVIEYKDKDLAAAYLQLPHWKWKSSPFNLPQSLKYLVGVTDYRAYCEENHAIS